MAEQLYGYLTIPKVIAIDDPTINDTVVAPEVLEGETCHARGNLIIGTMPNNPHTSFHIEGARDIYTIPQGYHDGTEIVAISYQEALKIAPENIRVGTTILGVEGALEGNTLLKTLTGNPLSFSDNIHTSLKSLKVSYSPVVDSGRFVTHRNIRINYNDDFVNFFHSVIEEACCVDGYLFVDENGGYFVEDSRCYTILSVDSVTDDGYFYNSSLFYGNLIDPGKQIITNMTVDYKKIAYGNFPDSYGFGIKISGFDTISSMNRLLLITPVEILLPLLTPLTRSFNLPNINSIQLRTGSENILSSPMYTEMEIKYSTSL